MPPPSDSPTPPSNRSEPCNAPRWAGKPPSRCARTSGCSARFSATRSASRTATRCSTSSNARASNPSACAGPRSTAPIWPKLFDGVDVHRRDPGDPRVHPFRAAGQCGRGHPPGAPPGGARSGRGAAAGQHPRRHVPEARRRRAGRRHRRRRPGRRVGVPGHHRASHRDAAPHRVRHPAPHHRVDAAAAARAHQDRRRPRRRTRIAPPHPHAVADRADPVVPA